MSPFRAALVLTSLFVVACSDSGGLTEVSVRDSAGVTILEHPAAAIAAAPAWSLGAPTVTIGGGEGEDQGFSFIATAHRLSDGRIVLADNEREGTRFLVYGADGTFERRLGRSGNGPGEFRNARILGVQGDTLLAYEFSNARVTRMRIDGTLVGTQELSRLGPMKVGMPSGLLPDGRILSSPIPFGDSTDHGTGVYRQEGGALAIEPAAATIDTLQRFPGSEVKLTTMSFGGESGSIPSPIGYGKRTLYATTSDRVHVATNASGEIATYRLPWALDRVTRLNGGTAPVDQAARDAQIAEALANIDRTTGVPEAFKTVMKQTVRDAAFADSMAHYQSITAGVDGSLWLRQMRSVADSVPHYLVVGADGRLAARIDLPKGARLTWTDGTQALVVLMDDNDLPRLELRPVVKGTAAN